MKKLLFVLLAVCLIALSYNSLAQSSNVTYTESIDTSKYTKTQEYSFRNLSIVILSSCGPWSGRWDNEDKFYYFIDGSNKTKVEPSFYFNSNLEELLLKINNSLQVQFNDLKNSEENSILECINDCATQFEFTSYTRENLYFYFNTYPKDGNEDEIEWRVVFGGPEFGFPDYCEGWCKSVTNIEFTMTLDEFEKYLK